MSRPHQRVHYIAGASGVGTSTRAFELRHTWEAVGDARRVHVICTDVVRAELRTALPQATHPDLWGESFNLPVQDGDVVRSGVTIDAFLRQCAPILRAVEMSVAYALTEGWDVIIEGVHLVPGEFSLRSRVDADVTCELLTVEDEDVHRARLKARDAVSGGRRSAEHYIANLERIRVIQDMLRDRHDACVASGWVGTDAS